MQPDVILVIVGTAFLGVACFLSVLIYWCKRKQLELLVEIDECLSRLKTCSKCHMIIDKEWTYCRYCRLMEVDPEIKELIEKRNNLKEDTHGRETPRSNV